MDFSRFRFHIRAFRINIRSAAFVFENETMIATAVALIHMRCCIFHKYYSFLIIHTIGQS